MRAGGRGVGTHSRAGRTVGTGNAGPVRPGWWAVGAGVDYYLAPAATGYDFYRAYLDLTGRPAVPPRHAMGFMVQPRTNERTKEKLATQ